MSSSTGLLAGSGAIKFLTDADIRELIPQAKIIVYHDLLDYDTIDEALQPYDTLVILYETSDHVGHWTCVFRENGIIYFFDSYGLPIDNEMEFIDPNFRIKDFEQFKYLSYLLSQAPEPIDYNDYQLQEMRSGENTCGRWVVARLKLRHLTNEQFVDLFADEKNITPDKLVIEYTNSL